MSEHAEPDGLLESVCAIAAGAPAPPTGDLPAAYAYCARIARLRAGNFAWGFILLRRAKRDAMVAAYAFSRVVDDIVDEDRPREQKLTLLAEVRRELESCTTSSSPRAIFLALGDTIRRFAIPLEFFRALIDGCEMDLDARRFRTFEDLHAYCYRVAGVVGLISVRIFGATDFERVRDGAADLGLAMQLTNIVRDLREDLDRGRVYLPTEDLERFGVSEEDLRAGRLTPGFRGLMAFEIARAREYFVRGRAMIPLVDADARFCPAVLARIYSRLLDRIEARGYDVFRERVRLSAWRKVGIMLRCAVQPCGA